MWTTTDKDGRSVVLTISAWRHIVEIHDELRVPPEAVLDVVSTPQRRVSGREPGEVWYYKTGSSPSRWLKVVVHYERGRGRIVTAFPRRSFP